MTDPINNVPQQAKLVGFDKLGLYRKEVFADPNAGEIICLVPITVGNVRDTERKMRFFSSVQAAVNGQPMVVPFELPADTLEGAIDAWDEAAKKASDDFEAKVAEQRLRRNLVMPSGARMPPKLDS